MNRIRTNKRRLGLMALALAILTVVFASALSFKDNKKADAWHLEPGCTDGVWVLGNNENEPAALSNGDSISVGGTYIVPDGIDSITATWPSDQLPRTYNRPDECKPPASTEPTTPSQTEFSVTGKIFLNCENTGYTGGSITTGDHPNDDIVVTLGGGGPKITIPAGSGSTTTIPDDVFAQVPQFTDWVFKAGAVEKSFDPAEIPANPEDCTTTTTSSTTSTSTTSTTTSTTAPTTSSSTVAPTTAPPTTASSTTAPSTTAPATTAPPTTVDQSPTPTTMPDIPSNPKHTA